MIRSRFAALVAALLLALGVSLVPAAPAQAGWPGGIVVHAPDDGGFAGDILVRCDGGALKFLSRGERASCGDVNDIYVAHFRRVLCLHTDGRWQLFDAQGWHGIGNWFNARCYHQVD